LNKGTKKLLRFRFRAEPIAIAPVAAWVGAKVSCFFF
jgi:hypothetical protein